ncbi:ABC transporter permease [Phormidesmis priestleyi ULC007]|uniref:ABC transporter permease n=1 Tax=Phormidesmis priestleyi ULC007 TaxID=1920490 RepID=A0A2T1DCY1_9CYAN|nr:ABC transporter permease [Phormidesmis priestleyi]PSB18314.1 ABC transporter permease [Phormidesmis priestleyi ULC007]PZO46530.1 MAG: ABC transporter permease [Phormidesmis priestleyi]
MKRILAQCTKELAQFRRDRLTLALAFILPVMTLFIFGFAIRLEAKNIAIVVQDFDRSNLSRRYTEGLYQTNQFVPAQWSGDDPMQDALDRGIAKAAVIIPPDFSRGIAAGKTSQLQVLIDGTDVNNARVIKNSIQAFTRSFLQDQNLMSGTSKITPRLRLWFNPGRRESLYIVPGVFGVILAIYPSLLAALAMSREKEQGTILQAYASSISAAELLLGKCLAYLVVGIGQAIFVIGLGCAIFRIWFVGDPSPFLIGTGIFLIASIMFGLLIGVRANNRSVAVQGVATAGFLLALLLSGFIYPLSNIPFPLSLVTNIVPARYFIEISRDAFVRGTGWEGVWVAQVCLVVLAFVLFNIARRILGRMQLPG